MIEGGNSNVTIHRFYDEVIKMFIPRIDTNLDKIDVSMVLNFLDYLSTGFCPQNQNTVLYTQNSWSLFEHILSLLQQNLSKLMQGLLLNNN